jgi:hypothetical protein
VSTGAVDVSTGALSGWGVLGVLGVLGDAIPGSVGSSGVPACGEYSV